MATRRDPVGYEKPSNVFDAELPRIFAKLKPGDLLVLTADHAMTRPEKGTDHTREQIPIMSYMRGMKPGSVGHRRSFADIGQTIARHLWRGTAGRGRGVGDMRV